MEILAFMYSNKLAYDRPNLNIVLLIFTLYINKNGLIYI